MKYPKEFYIGSGFYSEEDEITCYKEKIVTCRKQHKCSGCQKVIEPSEQAVNETGFLDGMPVSSYICLPCIEKWLEESGGVEMPEEEGDNDGR